MTKEEFRNIENMTLKEVCRFLEISPYELIAKNLNCIICPLYRNWCDSYCNMRKTKKKLFCDWGVCLAWKTINGMSSQEYLG